MAYGAEDIKEQQERVDRMEQLYFIDGRNQRDHKMHGLYTGLIDPQAPLHDLGTYVLVRVMKDPIAFERRRQAYIDRQCQEGSRGSNGTSLGMNSAPAKRTAAARWFNFSGTGPDQHRNRRLF